MQNRAELGGRPLRRIEPARERLPAQPPVRQRAAMRLHPLIAVKRPDRRLIPPAASVRHPADSFGDILRDTAHEGVQLRRVRADLGNFVLQIEPVQLKALVVFAQHGVQLRERVALLLVNSFLDGVKRIDKIRQPDERKAAVVINRPALRNIPRLLDAAGDGRGKERAGVIRRPALFKAVIVPRDSVDDQSEILHHAAVERLKIRRGEHVMRDDMLAVKKHRTVRLEHHLQIPAGA